jgi:RNA polymerase sigma-70 factor (ECF subfamily)
MSSRLETPTSLLDRVRRGDAIAWSEFSAQYSAMLRGWCLQWGLQSADADDLVQDTLLIVFRRIAEFRRRGTGSFRSWIRTIAWRCWCDAVARVERSMRAEVALRFRESLEARTSLEEEFQKLFENQILEQAMAMVKQRVQPSSWDAFRLTALENLGGEMAAEISGMQINAVYAARYRVQRLITVQMRQLLEDDSSHG